MRRSFFLALLLSSLGVFGQVAPKPAPRTAAPVKPKLIVGIVIDQFRYDYLTRFRSDYTGGLARMLTQGADFANAYQDHAPTVTAAGHAAFLTGSAGSVNGIVSNEWYDRATAKRVTSVSDDSFRQLGAEGRGASPNRLLASTLGDQMKMAGCDCKVIGISIKDRAAILPSGHAADGAYWFDAASGNFVSSTYYFPELPAWVSDFNKTRPADHWLGAKWSAVYGAGKLFRTMATTPDPRFYQSLDSSPFGNELIEDFAERAVKAERLGKHRDTDLLTISFSSNDYVGHAAGPDSDEVHDMSVRADRLLDKLFRFLDAQVGARNMLIVLTADHGVAPVPEVNQKRRMLGGRLNSRQQLAALEKALTEKYGEGRWILDASDGVYLNHELIREKRLDLGEVEETAAQAARVMPHIFRAFTAEQLRHGAVPPDLMSHRIQMGFNFRRSGDVIVVQDAFWIYGATGTSHGTPFNYDAHVPILFLGPQVKPGRYQETVTERDIAPTLAAILQVEPPSGSLGRVLDEMLRTR